MLGRHPSSPNGQTLRGEGEPRCMSMTSATYGQKYLLREIVSNDGQSVSFAPRYYVALILRAFLMTSSQIPQSKQSSAAHIHMALATFQRIIVVEMAQKGVCHNNLGSCTNGGRTGQITVDQAPGFRTHVGTGYFWPVFYRLSGHLQHGLRRIDVRHR